MKRLLWRYGWFRRLMTPTYQCPECRHAYHYCRCHGEYVISRRR
jgi:hypothetical protein